MALISTKIISLLQERIKHEEANSKLYLQMGYWLDLQGYNNAAKLYAEHSKDELQHKQWAVEHLLSLNILPNEPAEDQPQLEFKGLQQIIALTYKRELDTTNEVKELAKVAFEEGDLMTFDLGQRYVKEQIEEMDAAQALVDQLETFGDGQVEMKLLDNWIGENLLG